MILTLVSDTLRTDRCTCLIFYAGQTEVRSGGADDGDFLARERAALGDDAELFGGANPARQTTVEDDDDDLLGGGGDFAPSGQNRGEQFEDLDDFESSFPVVDTSNNVR